MCRKPAHQFYLLVTLAQACPPGFRHVTVPSSCFHLTLPNTPGWILITVGSFDATVALQFAHRRFLRRNPIGHWYRHRKKRRVRDMIARRVRTGI